MTAHPQRRRHIPTRTCVACRTSRAKRDLVRVVRTPEGELVIDETGKRNGRGAYLCRQQRCWELAFKRASIERALQSALIAEERVMLSNYMATLPVSLDPTGETVPKENVVGKEN